MIPYQDHHAARRRSLRRIPVSSLLLGLLVATLAGAPPDDPAHEDPRVAFHAGRWDAALAGSQAVLARDPTAILNLLNFVYHRGSDGISPALPRLLSNLAYRLMSDKYIVLVC